MRVLGFGLAPRARRAWRVLPMLLLALAVLGSSGRAEAANTVRKQAPSSKAPADAPPASDAQIAALRRALNAVVTVRVSATEGARTARSLGEERSGTGVVIDGDGLILTIGYLLLEAQTIEVVTQDDRRMPARQVAYDQATGFGLLQPLIPLRTRIEPVPMGSVSALAAGEALMVSSAGKSGAEVGVVRLVDRRAFSGYWEYHIDQALFTAPPVPNHSGAAVFNRNGELLGIGSLFVSDSQANGGALPGNMFVPVDLLAPVLPEMRSTGSTRASHRPWLGVSSQLQDGKVRIVRVERDGPAQRAGVGVGDEVLEVDGAPVDSLESFYKKVWTRATPDDEVELTLRQGDEVRKLRVQAMDRMDTLRKPQGI
ncbi:S1C family serine protease [Variovorax sp. OV329]|uniref:S1C family serine protease n=1 Tax=Variovorax sp. OV329 TaxID=1882825 RepID=UPI0008E0C598|nr:S1C family serine protease [Variovorax sp. OV329]SFM30806.1 serine protease, S1-C subfamily, contains C-terminal PDZ domain [Variovorax sp. OV329]